MSLASLWMGTVLLLLSASTLEGYHVGTGIGDITGPAAEVELMGYANPAQTAQGIHTRLFARAFVFVSATDTRKRFAYVNIDACMSSQLVTLEVISRLKSEYQGLYSEANVAISGTHTHASPAGFLQYVLYSITSLGFVAQTFEAMVEGILVAIRLAHASVRPARVYMASGQLRNASINRSPTAYMANPQQERDMYDADVDTQMTLLRVDDDASGEGRGSLSWFAVHCTSMNNTNRLISGDNKGVAEQLMEVWASRAQVARTAPTRTDTTQEGLATPAAQPCPSQEHCQQQQQPRLPKEAAAVEATHDLNDSDDVSNGSSSSSSSSMPGDEGNMRFSGDFVAAFAQASVGDTSPNILGAFCLDTGELCDAGSSTCNNRSQLCHGRGPAWPDDTASTYIIGERQYLKARELYMQAAAGREQHTELSGAVDYRHAYLDMANMTVEASQWTRPGRTCPAAMGMSFAAGTTDGPGAFDFRQGDTKGPLLWRLLSRFLFRPTQEQVDCQAPKPILLNTGPTKIPYEWQPSVTEISLLRLGSLLILGVPGEPTTMAGRRLKRAVSDVVSPAWGPVTVAISGLTNTYSSYITTYEEYQVQRYEGASTLYGPHTLDAYIQEFVRLARAMVSGEAVDPGTPPPNLLAQQVSLLPPVVWDAAPWGSPFGKVLKQPSGPYRVGDKVVVVFQSANPRNNLHTNGTFLLVERLVGMHATCASCTADHSNAAAPDGSISGSGSAGEQDGPGKHGSRGRTRRRLLPQRLAGQSPSSSLLSSAGNSRGSALVPMQAFGPSVWNQVAVVLNASSNGTWVAVHSDNDWCTTFKWYKSLSVSPHSTATISWRIPPHTPPGTYRIIHFGDAKPLTGGPLIAFEGMTEPFQVL